MFFCASFILAAAAPAQPAPDAAERFGAREHIEFIDLSPDGRRVVYLTPGPGHSTIAVVQDLSGGAQPQAVVRTDGDPERLRWCRFVANDRVICRVSLLMAERGTFIPYNRLLAVGTDGGQPQLLGERPSFFDAYIRQFDASILDWLPGEDGVVLMIRAYVPEAGRMNTRLVRRTEGLGVDRVDTRTLRSTSVEPANDRASYYISDSRGNVRIMAAREVRGATGQIGTRTDYFYRAAGDRRWQPFGSFDDQTREGMLPMAVDAEANAAYVLRKLNGRLALYRVKLDGSMASELVYANDEVDVDGLVHSAGGSDVIGVTFADEARRNIYFDRDYAELARMLGQAIPQLPIIDFVQSSLDGNKILVHAGSDSDPGRYYIYDRGSRTLAEIALARPPLENVRLANVRPVSYPAADGTPIPGYLTLPPGSDGRGLPAVVLPHGGPEARDEWGFDWLAQYLAARGYAVLQPNFRGSAGYGDQWMQENGFRGWRTSVGDIADGARWLAAQGIADPGRMAILGWSYGGYAALQAGATEPSLFKAIVAIAPVTDLQQLKEDYQFFSVGRNLREFIGSGPHVTEGSPARHASRIAAPVLLFHGDRDLNVLVGHSQRMDRALRDAGRQSELIVFPGLEHDLADGEARERMLERIGTFLASNLGR